MKITTTGTLLFVSLASAASAQIPGVPAIVGQSQRLVITESQEIALGANVSLNLRNRFGVVQETDAKLHRYVTLIGRTLADASERPSLPWTFIVLDTDGVNAFAAPGGYVHVTRGLLAMMQNEAELAGVLAHEIGHVEGKHIVNQMVRQAAIDLGAQQAPGGGIVKFIARKTYDAVVENKFTRDEERDADARAVRLTQANNYAPGMLGSFLTRLGERNKGIQDPKFRNGLFASHPDILARVEGISALTLVSTAKALVADRLAAHLGMPVLPLDTVQIRTEADPEFVEAPEEGGRRRFGLPSLPIPGRSNAKPTVTDAQLAARGVERDRHAKGGNNPQLVVVQLVAVELVEFKKGIL